MLVFGISLNQMYYRGDGEMQNSDLIIGCIVSLLVLLMYLVFKKYRYKVMMKELKKNTTGKSGNGIAISVYAGLAVIVLVGGMNCWNSFLEVYIAIPIAISGLYILCYRDKNIVNFYFFLKGLYYLSLAIYSIWQYYSESQRLSELAIGFTIALAIFESVTALIESASNLLKKNNA